MQKDSVRSCDNELLVSGCMGEAAPQGRPFPVLGGLDLCTVLYSSRPAVTRMQQMMILSIVSCGVWLTRWGSFPGSLRVVAEVGP